MVTEFIREDNKQLHGRRFPLGNMPESHKINAINPPPHAAQFCSNENSMAGPISPTGSTESVSYMENYLPGFDLAGHLQRKEIFSQRKQREFIPDNKKDESYWDRRKRNNEAAKRSREKRRFNDMILEQRVVELSNENHILKAQLAAIKDKFGINGENMVNVEQVMASLPSSEQGLTIPKRSKLSPGATPSSGMLYSPNVSPIPPPVLYSNSSHELYSQHNGHHHDNELPPYNNSSDNYGAFPFSPVLPPINPPVFESSSNIVLNLSRNRGKVKSRHKSVSSNSPRDSDNEESVHVPIIFSVNSTSNNSGLPHKLRHKIHLNEKDIPPVQSIKQEPEARATPPWDTEGSSDERDSGISLGQDWGVIRQNIASPPSTAAPIETPHDSRLQSEVARLVSEVENLKNYLTLKPSPTASTPPTKSNIPVK